MRENVPPCGGVGLEAVYERPRWHMFNGRGSSVVWVVFVRTVLDLNDLHRRQVQGPVVRGNHDSPIRGQWSLKRRGERRDEHVACIRPRR